MATDEARSQLVGVVVGENVRRLRESEGLTQDELARSARRAGLAWSRSQIAALEAGNRESVDLGVLVLLAGTLAVPLRELFEGAGAVRVAPDVTASRAKMRAILAGEPVAIVDVDAPGVLPTQADAEVAGRLGVMPQVVTDTARTLWEGRTLHMERDRRVSEHGDVDATIRRARRGHVTRELSKQIEEALHPKRGQR